MLQLTKSVSAACMDSLDVRNDLKDMILLEKLDTFYRAARALKSETPYGRDQIPHYRAARALKSETPYGRDQIPHIKSYINTIEKTLEDAIEREASRGRISETPIIFYSWLAQLPNSTNRGFIQRALERAVRLIRDDESIRIEPVVDRDTTGFPGSPDIADTILQKIENCDVFVCDVSIIGEINSPNGIISIPNPNVLFELGYALKRLGWGRIIMILNSAFGRVEDLPFDLRMKRVIKYEVRKEDQDKASVRRNLETNLKSALQEIFSAA